MAWAHVLPAWRVAAMMRYSRPRALRVAGRSGRSVAVVVRQAITFGVARGVVPPDGVGSRASQNRGLPATHHGVSVAFERATMARQTTCRRSRFT